MAPEGTVFDIARFFGLALNANPNILEVLYCEAEDIRWITDAGREIRKNRELFLSKRAVKSYLGYASAQVWQAKKEGVEEQERRKRAMHAVRLAIQLRGILKGEGLKVKVTGEAREWLLRIRTGEGKLGEGVGGIEKWFEGEAEDLRSLSRKSGLPPEPDYDKAEKLLIRLQTEALKQEER